MLDSLFFALFGLAVFLCILTALDREEIAWPVLSFPVWIILAATSNSIEIVSPIVMSDGTTATHVSEVSGGVFLMFLFLGMALVFVVMLFNRAREMWVRSVR